MTLVPQIDKRTGEQIVEQGKALGTEYAPDWVPREGDRGLAMLHLFGRLMEIVTSRLNRVPEKSFLAFLDTAGVSPLPPKAARAPVKFVAVKGAPDDGFVPAGTQIATAPPSGEEPAIFETEKVLVVHRARLAYLYTHDSANDRYDDRGDVLTENENNRSMTFQPFVGTTLIPHRLYLAQDMLFRINHPTTIILEFFLNDWKDDYESLFKNKLRWKTWSADEEKDVPLESGNITVDKGSMKVTVALEVTKLDQKSIADEKEEHFWIWAGTGDSLSTSESMMRIESISLKTEAADILPAAAFFNTQPLDLAREFYPFGARPKLYDTFFFAVPEVFAREGSTVTIVPRYTPGKSTASDGVTLTWDFWNGTTWGVLGESNSSVATAARDFAFIDTTSAFTATDSDNEITFTCPAMAQSEVNGKKNYWVRVRITGGNYGEDAKMTLKSTVTNPTSLADWDYQDISYNPPVITSLKVSYQYTTGRPLTALRVENNFTFAPSIDPPFQPFVTSNESQPALYLGFVDRIISPRPVSLFVAVKESLSTISPTVVWEYWNGGEWKNLGGQDGTANLTKSGTVEFIGPTDAIAGNLFGTPSPPPYWIRARLESGDKQQTTLLGAYLNTTWAKNCTTVRNEILGSSTETPNTVFTLSRFPVLEGLNIEVREPDQPAEEELAILRGEEGYDVLRPVKQGTTPSRECWVRWHRVEHLRFSGKKDRHYLVDWATGRVRFGNGVNGMIPPAGRDNVRAALYQFEGGTKGNVASNTITTLKRSIPFVDKAFNVDRAGGGSDTETNASVMVRGPQAIKNRNRAVTLEDYEWLAKEASFQVARAKCLPAKTRDEAGKVRLIVVPWSDDPKPSLSQGLIRQVEDHLNPRERRISTAQLSVEKPEYVEVSVQATVFPEKPEEADLVRRQVNEKLTEFFHPLHGGPEETGWEFGRDVYVSEVCKVIEDTEGVHHAEDVRLSSAVMGLLEAFSIPVNDNQLVSSGEHTLIMRIVGETTPGGGVHPLGAGLLGNLHTRELHDLGRIKPQCQLDRIRPEYRISFRTVEEAQKRGYDMCGWCFGPEASKR